MDNSVFNKRLKIGIIVIASIVAVLFIVWFTTKNGQGYSNEISNDSTNEMNSNTTNDCGCINENNYAEMQSFEDAIKMLYLYDEIPESPAKYKNYNESINGKFGWRNPFPYKAIDNYRLFLSEKADCNQGKEPFRCFICHILSDDSFFKSRVSLSKIELDNFKHIECYDFQFYFNITPIYMGKQLVGHRQMIYSWEELQENKAIYVETIGNDILCRYTFTRVDGRWYLTEFFEPNEWY